MAYNNKVQKTGQYVVAPNAASANLIANHAFYRHEALRIVYGASSTLTAPPAGPYVQGQSYLIRAASPTGEWTGLSNHIVQWYAGHWCIIPPIHGMTVVDKSTGSEYTFFGNTDAWRCTRGVYNAGTISSGTLTINCAEGTVFKVVVTGSFTLAKPSNMQPGVVYQLILHNASGSNRTMTSAANSWFALSNSVLLFNGYRRYIRFMLDPGGLSRALMLHFQDGEIGSPA